MNQSDWSVVLNHCCILRLMQQSHQCPVYIVKISEVSVPQGVKHIYDVTSDDGPGSLQKMRREAISPRRLVRQQRPDYCPNLSLGEALAKASELKSRQVKEVQVDSTRLHRRMA
jgi:hypothetical protein